MKTQTDSNIYALVTGASSGIGNAIAWELASKKNNLILVALPGMGLFETANQISSNFNIAVKFCELDLTQEGAANQLYKWCCEQNFKINVLVNNAGLGAQGLFEDTTVSDLETMLKLNNQALVMLAYYFLSDLKSNGPSNILNVGSLASFMNIPGKAVYSASKSFIYSFSAALRMELRPHKINVSCLCPGGTITSNRVKENISKVRFASHPFLQKPQAVAREAVRQMLRGKRLIIPGWHNKFLYQLWAILPERIVNMILCDLFFKKETTTVVALQTGV